MGNWLPKLTYLCFNTQPRGGGCTPRRDCVFCNEVSTHSRAEAAARRHIDYIKLVYVSTHSRAEAAAANDVKLYKYIEVSTHSRAEAAAF